MNYTPFAHLTDAELVREVCNKEDVTDLELELMHRLDYWMEYAAALGEHLHIDARTKVETRYKEDVHA